MTMLSGVCSSKSWSNRNVWKKSKERRRFWSRKKSLIHESSSSSSRSRSSQTIKSNVLLFVLRKRRKRMRRIDWKHWIERRMKRRKEIERERQMWILRLRKICLRLSKICLRFNLQVPWLILRQVSISIRMNLHQLKHISVCSTRNRSNRHALGCDQKVKVEWDAYKSEMRRRNATLQAGILIQYFLFDTSRSDYYLSILLFTFFNYMVIGVVIPGADEVKLLCFGAKWW